MKNALGTGSCTSILQMAGFTQGYSILCCKDKSKSKKAEGIHRREI